MSMAGDLPIEAIKAKHPRAYEAWRPIDDVILRALVRTPAEISEIAEHLGRTESEVRMQLTRLGLARLAG